MNYHRDPISDYLSFPDPVTCLEPVISGEVFGVEPGFFRAIPSINVIISLGIIAFVYNAPQKLDQIFALL